MDLNGEAWLIARVAGLLQGRQLTIFDVGANVGEWSTRVSASIGGSWNLFLFEPCTTAIGILTGIAQHITERAGTNARIFAVALGGAEGTAELQIYGATAGVNSLLKRDMSALGIYPIGAEVVRVATGDAIAREVGVTHIDFMKIDTEGYEVEVLKGFSGMLSRREIGIVQFEYGGSWTDSRATLKDVFEFLTPFGYVVGKLLPDRIEWSAGYGPRLETLQYSNFVAVRQELRGALDG